MKLKRIVKTNAAQAANILRNAILQGDLPPGIRLREEEVCSSIGISRTPLREAFRILESENLIEILPNKGVNVTKLTEVELSEIYEIRELIETFCIRMACDAFTEMQFDELENILDLMENRLKEGNREEYLEASTKFHEYYIANCKNTRLFKIFRSLWNSVIAVQALTKINYKSRQTSMIEHREILAALRNRNKNNAEKAIKTHLKTGYIIAIEGLKKGGVPPEK